MTSCEHCHKDAPEGSLCEDCYYEPIQSQDTKTSLNVERSAVPDTQTLKTLKEIKYYKKPFQNISAGNYSKKDSLIREMFAREIRQEAIKWVKICIETTPDAYLTPWIKFFNLTEEDLK